MSNEDDGHAHLLLYVAHEVEYLGLGRDVQGGGRLVGNKDAGAARQRHGNHRTLSETSAQLEGILVYSLLRQGNTHLVQRLDGDVTGILLGDVPMKHDGFNELVSYR